MSILRPVCEWLFRSLFTLTRVACFAQAVALLIAVFLTGAWAARETSPAWVRWTLMRAVLLLVTFLTTAILLHIMIWRSAAPIPPADAGEPKRPENVSARSPWLGLSMVALAALAVWQANDLFALWRFIADGWSRLGIGADLTRSAPNGGIVFAPILAALYTPALEAAAAFHLTAVPLGLLVLWALQSRLFPRMYFLMATCQVGLILAGILAADTFAHLSHELTPFLIEGADEEGMRIAQELARARTVLVSTASAFLVPLAGYLAWVPSLLREQSRVRRSP